MCSLDPVTQSRSYQAANEVFKQPCKNRTLESKVFEAIRYFFLACTAISGVAFVATLAPEAFGAFLVLGILTIALYFPEALTSNHSSYQVNRSFQTTYPQRPPVVVVEQPRYEQRYQQPIRAQPQVIVVEQPRYEQPRPRTPPSVFASPFPQAGHHRSQLPQNIFSPTQEDAFSRHTVGQNQPPRREERPQVRVPQVVPQAPQADLQERHAVGGRPANIEPTPQDPQDPFARHQVGK